MAAGHIVGAQCLDVATAGHAIAHSIAPSLMFDGTNSHLHEVVYDEWDNMFAIYHTVDGSFVESFPYTPVLSNCDTEQPFFDAMAVGWLVVAAMGATWAIVFLKKALYR